MSNLIGSRHPELIKPQIKESLSNSSVEKVNSNDSNGILKYPRNKKIDLLDYPPNRNYFERVRKKRKFNSESNNKASPLNIIEDDLTIKENIKKLKKSFKKTVYKVVNDSETCLIKNNTKIPLANILIFPVRVILVDDGLKLSHQIEITGFLNGKEPLPLICVSIEELQNQKWIEAKWGFSCLVYPNVPKAYEHLITALKIASTNIEPVRIYNYIGWTKIEDDYYYLHALGAIGKKEIEVKMDPDLYKFCIKKSKKYTERMAYHGVMDLLGVANKEITIPLLAYSMLSLINYPLKASDHEVKFILWLHGESGARKTTIAKLFTCTSCNKDIPTASFKDTICAIEKLTFDFKDATLVLDDYHPSINKNEKDQMDKTAHHFLRVIGDRVTKRRMNSNLEEQKEFPPRCLMIITGEDIVEGVSATSRCLSLPMKKEDVDLEALTHCQNRPNLLSTFTYYYIQFLSERMSKLPELLNKRFLSYREQFKNNDYHGRFLENETWLMLSYELLMEYGKELGIITEKVITENLNEALNIFSKLLQTQYYDTKSEDPVAMFLSTIKELISSNQAHIEKIGMNSNNKYLMGWEDELFYYLIPETTYSNVVSFWRKQNKIFPLSSKKLNEMLHQKKIIEVEEKVTNENITCKRTVKKQVCNDKRLRVLQIKKEALDEYIQ